MDDHRCAFSARTASDRRQNQKASGSKSGLDTTLAYNDQGFASERTCLKPDLAFDSAHHR